MPSIPLSVKGESVSDNLLRVFPWHMNTCQAAFENLFASIAMKTYDPRQMGAIKLELGSHAKSSPLKTDCSSVGHLFPWLRGVSNGNNSWLYIQVTPKQKSTFVMFPRCDQELGPLCPRINSLKLTWHLITWDNVVSRVHLVGIHFFWRNRSFEGKYFDCLLSQTIREWQRSFLTQLCEWEH